MSTFKGVNDMAALRKLCGPGLDRLLEDAPAPAKIELSGNPGQLVEPGCAIVNGVLTAFLPVITRSEANETLWQRKMRRKLGVKRAMRECLGPHLGLFVPYSEAYHAGAALRVTFTRLGGRKLDQMANLGNSMKVVEDVICGILLADDGDSRWHVMRPEQEPGGAIGVKVEIEIFS